MNESSKQSINKTDRISNLAIAFFLNRMQMLYFIIFIPHYLEFGYMLIAILFVGLYNQFNLWIISQWKLTKKESQSNVMKNKWFNLLFLLIVIPKLTINLLGYTEAVHKYVYTSSSIIFILLAMLFLIVSLMKQGLTRVVNFSLPIFLATFWVIFFIVPFVFYPDFSSYRLFDVSPPHTNYNVYHNILLLFASFSGVEFLLFVEPNKGEENKLYKYLTFGNILSTMEYFVIMFASVMFFGSNLLGRMDYPLLSMLQYVKTPFTERLDIILISFQMFQYVLIGAFLFIIVNQILNILITYKNIKLPNVFTNTWIILYLIIVYLYFWRTDLKRNFWIELQIFVGAFSTIVVPLVILFLMKVKKVHKNV